MPGTKSRQAMQNEELRSVLDDLLFYAKPISEQTFGAGYALSDNDAWISFRAAVHRAEKAPGHNALKG